MRPTDTLPLSPAEQRELQENFMNEITTRNLRWIWWLTLTSTGLLVLYTVLNVVLPSMRSPRLLLVNLVDLAVTVLVLAAVRWARRSPPEARWRRWLPVGYVAMVFAIFDWYHLSALGTTGHTGSYILGVMAVGLLVLLPPRVFLPLLLGNHALYLTGVVLIDARSGARVLAAMDGSAGVLVAGLASWLLFSSRWRDFQRERLLLRSNAQLGRLNAEMNELMAITAHDLRSPLEGVRRLLGLVRSRTEWGREQVDRAAETCLRSCTGMVELIGRLLDAHALEHRAEQGLALTELDLVPCFRAAAERARVAAAGKQLRLDIDLVSGPALARVEATALEQVLDNLLGNAIKYSPPGGGVTLSLSAGAGGAGWRGEVRDNGPGVVAAERAALFQKFHRGGAQPTGGESSSGLGLYVVKRLMEAMNGRVGYAAREGGGSVFWVEWNAGV